MKSIAVLGCGPTGLLVAHAVQQAGHVPHIISKKRKSIIPGSQHLHGSISGLTSPYPEGTIQFVRIGTARGYAEKVYGDPSQATGWENYLQLYPSWNVIKAYDKLWDRFENEISDCEITITVMPELVKMYDEIISTIPAQELCIDERHHFESVPYYIQPLPTPPADEGHEIVVYNGLRGDPWYRWSILGGRCSIEYSQRPLHLPETAEVITGWKAISNDCCCWPTVHRCGRWAEWRHGVTMYKSYIKATEILEALHVSA